MRLQKHIIAVISLLIIIAVGFYSKIYSGFAHQWVNNKLGGLFYEIFWILLFYILLIQAKPFKIALCVLIATCALEFIQLLNNGFLQIIRANFIGRSIIGSSFTWSDFPYYFVGSFLGYIILTWINRQK